ncbi:MAG TPA: DNA gyrase inhibitor YacG [Bryobacteraceae bacterium]|jgi:endogenous inhibitor of DNA gyrase (YacG/DUF329 family)|nr:DNA gyrase inhibitor YacG [Bryobacteraceae bacterium]
MPQTVRCPICKKEVPFDAPEMPFCSKRCRLLDLGNWAAEKYVISTPAHIPDEEESDDSEGPKR